MRSYIRNLFRSDRKRTLGYLEDGHTGFTIRDRFAKPSNEENNPAVNACISVLSNGIGNFPLVTYERLRYKDKDIGREKAKDFHVYPILRYNINPEMTSTEYYKLIIRSLCTTGNFIGEITYLGSGRFNGVIPIATERVKLKRNGYLNDGAVYYAKREDIVYGELVYLVDEGRETEQEFKANEVIHCKINSKDGLWGTATTELAAADIEISNKMNQAALSACDNIIMPSVVFKADDVIPDKEKIEENYKNKNQGAAHVGQVLFADGPGADIKTLSIDAAAFAFLEQRKFQDGQICKHFGGLSPSIIGDQSESKYSSLSMDNQHLLQRALKPLCDAISDEHNRKCFTPEERKTYYCEFNYDALLQPMTKERYDAYAVGVHAGFLDVNEVREKENLKTQPTESVPAVGGSAAPGSVDSIVKSPVGETPGQEAAPVEDVQSQAMNGAQTASLLEIADKVVQKQLPAEAAKMIIAAAFPSLDKTTIDGIINSLSIFEPPAPEPEALDNNEQITKEPDVENPQPQQ
jgi:HK97 family phage portal protein